MKILSAVILNSAIVISVPLLLSRYENWLTAPTEATDFRLPGTIGGWQITEKNDDWVPHFPGAVVQQSVYQYEQHSISLFVGYYPVQRQGRELINSGNRISDGEAWRAERLPGVVQLTNGDQFIKQILQNSIGQQLVVWYWYEVAGTQTTNQYMAKLLQLFGYATNNKNAFIAAIAVDRSSANSLHVAEFIEQLRKTDLREMLLFRT